MGYSAKFYDTIRDGLFHGWLGERQFSGLNDVLGVVDAPAALALSGTTVFPRRWKAYVLATVWWETDFTMQPVAEIGRGRGYPYGQPAGPYGQCYYGRGYPQLTWYDNYLQAHQRLSAAGVLHPGQDVCKTPDLACDPEVSAFILISGMTQGWFTGRKLENYFPIEDPSSADWYNARRIVNGLDHANDIGDAAQTFFEALLAEESA